MEEMGNMEFNSVGFSLLGGGLIGIAATLMLLFNGRITGISGILYSVVSGEKSTTLWSGLFLVGLISGGAVMRLFFPNLFLNLSGRGLGTLAIAGILVGYGTVMGGGCTSGHGICGLSRLSIRSGIATLTFMLFGFLAVQFLRLSIGGSL